MTEYSEVFVAFDTSKTKHAVAVAEGGRDGEIRYLGEVESGSEAVERLVRKLAGRYGKVHFCYEAGPAGYDLYRQLRDLGHGPGPTVTLVANSEVGDRCGFQGLSRRYLYSRNAIKSVVLNAEWYGRGIRHQCQQSCHKGPFEERGCFTN